MHHIHNVLLERAGFNVVTFNDPSIALERFQPDLYDLVLLDIIMPKMDGYELYKKMKKVDPNATICFLTASEKYREELRKEEYCAFDIDLFIRKPISTIGLIREVTARIKVT